MSTPAPPTAAPSSDDTLPTVSPVAPASTKILSLVSQNGEDEPIGFALLMSPYKAKLVDIETATASIVKRVEEITNGQSSSSSTEQFRETVSKSFTAEDLDFQATLYTSKQVNDRGKVPRLVFPLPVDIRDQLMINYQSSDQGMAALLGNFGADLAKNINQGKGLDMGADSRNAALAAGGLMLANKLGITGSGTLAEQYLGQILNPFTVTAFRNVEPRVFNFEFRITPKNADQSETLQECINTLRYCALPDPTDNGLTLEFPYRFKLAWLGSLKMFDFSDAILSRMEVNYASGGSPAFFEYTESSINGASAGYHPVAVTIVLEFRELFPLNKETIVPRRTQSNYNGEMRPRKLGRDEIQGKDPPPSSPETQGGATTTDPAENQTGTGDDALNTPVNTNQAIIDQNLATMRGVAPNIDFYSKTLSSTLDAGLTALPSTEVYLAINNHDNRVETYNNALLAVKLYASPTSPVQQSPSLLTWFQKVEAGKSGSKTSLANWEEVYTVGRNEWNKISGGGP